MKRIRITPYDPTWPRRYEQEAPQVATAIGRPVIASEHIGSTAVPGLEAKLTIDILVGVDDIAQIGEETKAGMAELGYEPRGELGVPGRRYFRKGNTFPRAFNVHVVKFESPLWRSNIAFRNYLRAHPEVAAEYGRLKRSLISVAGGVEPERYAAGKEDFIAEVLRCADADGC